MNTAALGSAQVTAAKINLPSLPFNFSTTEIDTGFTWVDGKHIYQKTVNTGTMPAGVTKTVAHGVTGISAIIDVRGMISDGAGQWRTLPYPTPNTAFIIGVNVDSTNINIATVSSYAVYTTSYVTLWYTK